MILPGVELLARLPDATLAALREKLNRAGYDERALSAGERVAPGTFDAVRLPLVRFALRKDGTSAAQLALLLAYATEVPEDGVRELLGASLVNELRQAGFLEPGVQPGHLLTRFRLLPLEGCLVLSDDPAAGGDTVMGPGPTTAGLLRLLPRALSGAVLDLGCGAGTLAVVGARRGAQRAVGTDVNARAVHLAEVNARLNGVRAEFRIGDLYAPVEDERFDLVVCQPPYVLQPPGTAGVVYLHGGSHGDALALRMIADVPRTLADGGQGIFLFDAPVLPGRALHTRIREALAGAAVDVLLFTAPGPSPDLQAAAYASLEVPDFGAAYEAAALRYRAHVDAIGVSEFSRVLLVVRDARQRATSAFTVSLPVPSLETMGAAVLEETLAGLDLAAQQDGSLSRAHVIPHPRARWVEERSNPTAEPSLSLRFPPGSRSGTRQLSEASAALLGVLGESPNVGQAVERYAVLCEARPDEVRAQVLDFVREGLGTGLLISA